MSATLSISIIAKNEEHNLPRCINSIKNLADEIILVDTGSTDNTIRVATELGAKVFFHPWNNDFSEAKNAALSHCTKDWVLVMDCDEALDPSDLEKVKAIVNNTTMEAFYFRLINYIGDIAINETSSLRLFRNRPEYKFVSKLHEQIFYSITALKGSDVFQVTDIKLNHYGYDHNVVDMSKKIERNIEVLESFESQHRDGFFYFSLGNEYSKLGNNEKAKEYFYLSLHTTAPDYGYYPYLAVNLVKLLLSLKEPLEALVQANIFASSMPDFKDIYFLKSMCEYELCKFNDSYYSLLKYNELSKLPAKYPSFNIENDNDVPSLIKSLDSLRVEHPYNLSSTLIINEGNITNMALVVNGVADISEEVYILDKRANIKSNRKLSGNCFASQVITEEALIEKIKSESNSAWLLIIKNQTVLETIHKGALIPGLINSKSNTLKLWKPGDIFIKIKDYLLDNPLNN